MAKPFKSSFLKKFSIVLEMCFKQFIFMTVSCTLLNGNRAFTKIYCQATILYHKKVYSKKLIMKRRGLVYQWYDIKKHKKFNWNNINFYLEPRI